MHSARHAFRNVLAEIKQLVIHCRLNASEQQNLQLPAVTNRQSLESGPQDRLRAYP